jgi:hypothetical protein
MERHCYFLQSGEEKFLKRARVFRGLTDADAKAVSSPNPNRI